MRGVFRWTAAILVSLATGCHSLKVYGPAPERLDRPDKNTTALATPQPSALPCNYFFRIQSFLFQSDTKIDQDLGLFRELAGLEDQVDRELLLPHGNAIINVYLFENKDRYEKFMALKYPDLPKRRAFFVAQPHPVGSGEDLLVYTWWGGRIQEDLRHELTHALLHGVLKDVPLWLDEGLAEYFEVSPACDGVNNHHLEQIRKGEAAFHPDLARLEKLTQVQQMSPAEYREAWAWVHFMLREKPEGKRVLIAYLQQLRVSSNAGVLAPKLAAVYPAPGDSLSLHLARLQLAPNPPVTPVSHQAVSREN